MPSERVQRQIDRLLDQIEEAAGSLDWSKVKELADGVLRMDPENQDAKSFLDAADRDTGLNSTTSGQLNSAPGSSQPDAKTAVQPTSFANGRYLVTRFLGEGGKKKVYLAKDTRLDREVAFALIKTEGLDEASRVRVQREAEAMGRLGAHPHIVTVFDIGEEDGQPYLVLPVLAGGDVEAVIEKAPENKLAIERAVKIATDTCLGLEFAHSKGIVHRDLKPGNVWLTEDGRAMIGDFGLAVAVDRSRLTQAGMMVGTVSYMPPEQAMGGEVGPRSDLYSLGAMLYEMVCGRPPFVGDESVAIIGQHLNTPPVAPSWHRPDCPPALEALILRLLEKDPSKRPASAEEVRKALESINTTTRPRDPTVATEQPTAGDNPLYRRTFVGRENEVRQLQQAFDAALSGQGGLVMVVGEPGIGKTALCEQLATYVALRGGKALVGHCYEEGSLSLPYLAFVEAMRSYVLAREPEGLRSDLGTGAADVARIVSEVRDRVQGVELRPAGDPEDDRWRLLQAVTSFLRNASTVQPLCIVLEDLHWADRGTLDLLLHVSRNLQGTRLLLIGNYRDVEVDRTHQLSGVLADLRRINSFASVRLRGLTVDEVHRMYESVRGQAVPWGQAEAVFRATEGNPLFVQEVLRFLVEEGVVAREGGRYVAQQGEGVGIPESLRDVVGKRLNRLGEKTNQVLSIAAVIGRDFRLDVLQAVANLPEEEVIQALEEATERAVVEQRQGFAGQLSFRFTHAFFRQTLYEELFAARRIRMHQQVARALEGAYGRRVEEHAAELAEHYANSSDPADLEKSVHYSEVAAQRALTVYAYGEAVRHLEQALKAQEVLNPDDRTKLCDLLLGLGQALSWSGKATRAVEEVAPAALALAEATEDKLRAARACLLFLNAATSQGGGARFASDEYGVWAKRAVDYAPAGTVEEAQAETQYGRSLRNRGDRLGGWEHGLRALELARRLGQVIPGVYTGVIQALGMPSTELAKLRLATEVESSEHHSNEAALGSAGVILLAAGERPRAEALWHELAQLAGIARLPGVQLIASLPAIMVATVEGRLEVALDLGQELETLSSELDSALSGRRFRLNGTRSALLYLGRAAEVLASLEEADAIAGLEGDSPDRAVQRGLCLAHLGRLEEARGLVLQATSAGYPEETSPTWLLSTLLELAVMLDDRDLAARIMPRLHEVSALIPSGPTFFGTCIARHLGEAALLLGDGARAKAYYAQALDFCGKIQHRPETALIQLDLAELLLEHYPDERDAAIEHLDFAIAELRDMKMQPALERALRHRGLLKA